MKKNKLLPLVGIGAVCTAVTPLTMLTSCKEAGWVNALKRYIPSGEQHDWASLSENDCTYAYYSEGLADEVEIFKKDFYWSVSNVLLALQKEALVLQEIKSEKLKQAEYEKIANALRSYGYVTVTAVKVAHSDFLRVGRNHDVRISNISCKAPVQYPETGEDKINVLRLSYTLDYKYEYEDRQVGGRQSITTTSEVEGTTVLEDIPYGLAWNSMYRYWAVSPLVELMATKGYCESYPWKAEIDMERTITEVGVNTPYGDYTAVQHENIDKEWHSGATYTDPEISLLIDCLEEDGWCYSWYMYNVGYAPRASEVKRGA